MLPDSTVLGMVLALAAVIIVSVTTQAIRYGKL
jgi:hypothetical protein